MQGQPGPCCRVDVEEMQGQPGPCCRVDGEEMQGQPGPCCRVDGEEWRGLHDAQPQPEGDAAGRTYAVHAAAASVQHNAQRGSGALSSHRRSPPLRENR